LKLEDGHRPSVFVKIVCFTRNFGWKIQFRAILLLILHTHFYHKNNRIRYVFHLFSAIKNKSHILVLTVVLDFYQYNSSIFFLFYLNLITSKLDFWEQVIFGRHSHLVIKIGHLNIVNWQFSYFIILSIVSDCF